VEKGDIQMIDPALFHSDIEYAVGQRLYETAFTPSELNPIPICWPNDVIDPARPLLIFTHNVEERGEAGLNGGGIFQRGFFQVAVMIDANTKVTLANSIAGQIMARFPKGPLPLANGGKVVVMSSQIMGSGYSDGADWRLPVRITYQTTG
jgi:Bacteriophage related domain of unknown function